jgi:hypothetical protein
VQDGLDRVRSGVRPEQDRRLVAGEGVRARSYDLSAGTEEAVDLGRAATAPSQRVRERKRNRARLGSFLISSIVSTSWVTLTPFVIVGVAVAMSSLPMCSALGTRPGGEDIAHRPQ